MPEPRENILALSGRLEAVPLSDVLQILAHSARTGKLTIERDDPPQRGELEFRDGRMIQARLFPVPEPLGAVLLRHSALQADVLGEALRRQSSAARWKPLGQVLLEMNALDEPQLEHALSEHMQQIAGVILSWDRGVYRYYTAFRQPEQTAADVDVALDPHRVVLEAARRRDEAVPVS